MLSVSPVGVQSGENVCPNTTVVFTCVANQVAVVTWTKNDTEIHTFTSSVASPAHEDVSPFVAYLNSSIPVSSGGINATSTLVAMSISDLQSGENIGCGDGTITKKNIVLDYTVVGKCFLYCKPQK